jgi:hypothetical protein
MQSAYDTYTQTESTVVENYNNLVGGAPSGV